MAPLMKAWQYTKGTSAQTLVGKLEDSLTLNSSASAPETSALTKDQFIVEIVAAAINPIDYKTPESDWLGKSFALGKDAQPGLDFSGRIIGKHPDNTVFIEGQDVFGSLAMPSQYGALGQFVIASTSELSAMPLGISFDNAAALGISAGTAHKSLPPDVVKPGSQIFINGGSGGVGTFTIQFAKIMGARVTVSCSTANIELVRSLGADDVIDYKKTDVLAELKRLGRVFDVAIDNVGTPKNLYERSAEFLKKRGSYVQVAANPTFADTYPLLMKMIMSTLGGCLTPGFKFVTGRATRDDFNTFGRWVEEGRPKPVISETFKFEDVPEAYAKLREGRARGKIVLHVATITAKNS